MAKFLLALTAIISAVYGVPLESASGIFSNVRIVGGRDADSGQFPWQVSLRRIDSNEHFCGGSIIHSKWILTAAHCLVEESASDISVIAGSVSLSSGGDSYQASRIIIHEGFDARILKHDIALLEVSSDIILSEDVQIIALETENVRAVDCTVSGWGTTDFMGPRPDTLQFIELKTIHNLECILRLNWSTNSISGNNVCTFTKYGEGTCHGDSGGPLVANGKQIGIVSWGNPCAIEFPDVYTRVSVYEIWISNIINDK